MLPRRGAKLVLGAGNLRYDPSGEGVVDELHFDGDPATDSTRRRLERIIKDQPRSRWPWFAALAAGGTAFAFWQVRRRRRQNGDGREARQPGTTAEKEQERTR